MDWRKKTDLVTEDNGSQSSAADLPSLSPHSLPKLSDDLLIGWSTHTVRLMTQLEDVHDLTTMAFQVNYNQLVITSYTLHCCYSQLFLLS